MNKVSMSFLASLMLFAAISASAADATSSKPKIGVMKFEVDPDVKPGLGIFLYNGLMDHLIQSQQFTVVDWEQIDRVLGYIAKSQPTLSPDEARKQAIHQLGLEKMCLGSLTKVGSKFNLSVKVLNLDLTIAASKRVTVASEDDLEQALQDVAPAIVAGALPAQAGEKYLAQLNPQKAAAAAPSASAESGSVASVTKEKPFENSLGMKFVPVAGTKVLFCVWETRVKDFEAFVDDTRRDMGNSMWVTGSDGFKERSGYNWQKPGFRQTPDHPAVGVNWNDAVAFCEWLTRKERKENRIGASQTYRLPTDEEWSEAVGSNETPGGLRKDKDGKIKDQYPWGRSWPPPRGAGNYAGSEARTDGWRSDWKAIDGYSDDYARTAPVGSFDANEFGLYDLGGNVWEWCEDRYDSEQDWRVLRGGSWFNFNSGDLLSSGRGRNAPGFRLVNVGFRVVLVGGSSR